MKKRNCRKTPEEIRQHEAAVKIRKMTDAQISEFLEQIQVIPDSGNKDPIQQFFQSLDSLAGTGNGISTGTIYKLRKIAEQEGFLPINERGV